MTNLTLSITPAALTFNHQRQPLRNGMSHIMLEALYQKALVQENLTFAELQQAVEKVKPFARLQRVQVSRMLGDIEAAMLALNLPFTLSYNARQKTVGPWQLVLTQALDWVVEMGKMGEIKEIDPHSALLHRLFLPNVKPQKMATMLCQLLSQWAKSLAYFELGFAKEALSEIKDCYRFPITPFTTQFLNLFQAKFYLAQGNYLSAKNLILAILDCAEIPHQSYLVSLAKVMLMRIRYDESPAVASEKLLNELMPPEKYPQADPVALMEWHNLQSLLLKRKLLKTLNKKSQESLHAAVLIHLQEAIILSLMLDNKSRFLDFCANYVLYLQSVLEIGFSNVQEIIKWYQFIMTYYNKFSTGDYSIWTSIFYAQFYLKYEARCKSLLSLTHFEIEPSREQFYLETLAKAKSCSHLRQIIIFYFSYFEYAKNHLRPEKVKVLVGHIIHQLNTHPALCAELIEDNYKAQIEAIFQYDSENGQQASKQASKQASNRMRRT